MHLRSKAFKGFGAWFASTAPEAQQPLLPLLGPPLGTARGFLPRHGQAASVEVLFGLLTRKDPGAAASRPEQHLEPPLCGAAGAAATRGVDANRLRPPLFGVPPQPAAAPRARLGPQHPPEQPPEQGAAASSLPSLVQLPPAASPSRRAGLPQRSALPEGPSPPFVLPEQSVVGAAPHLTAVCLQVQAAGLLDPMGRRIAEYPRYTDPSGSALEARVPQIHWSCLALARVGGWEVAVFGPRRCWPLALGPRMLSWRPGGPGAAERAAPPPNQVDGALVQDTPSRRPLLLPQRLPLPLKTHCRHVQAALGLQGLLRPSSAVGAVSRRWRWKRNVSEPPPQHIASARPGSTWLPSRPAATLGTLVGPCGEPLLLPSAPAWMPSVVPAPHPQSKVARAPMAASPLMPRPCGH